MIGIITAVASERDAVLEIMTEIRSRDIYKIEFYEGKIHNTGCVTAMSGVGKVNASRCAQLLIDKFGPDRIVNVGSAGALHPDLNIGDVIISTSCIQHDVDLTAFGLPKGFFAAEDGFIAADLDFLELCQKAMARTVGGDFKVLTGPIATGDQFSDVPEHKDTLYEEFGAYCIEMEGAAIAQVCAMCGVPFVIIRSISDQANGETLQSYSQFKALAAERCASFLTNLVAVLEYRADHNGGPMINDRSGARE